MAQAASNAQVVTYAMYNKAADVTVERLRLNVEETQARNPDPGPSHPGTLLV